MNNFKEQEFLPVKSSHIEGINYDKDKKDLHIKFKDGTINTYRNVSEMNYQAMMLAVSKGKFLKEKIHNKHFHSQRKGIKQ